MLGSKSKFFAKDLQELKEWRTKTIMLLELKGYSEKQISIYLKAFDYFCSNPNDFDGATIVKDLQDLPHLDLDAMLHDYQYLVLNTAANFYTKWYSDWMYAKGQERKGKGQYSSFSRFLGLTIIGVFFVPYAGLKRGKTTLQQENIFFNDYNILMK